MKKTLRMVLAAFMAVAMVAFVSCGKDDKNNNANNGTENPTLQSTVVWVDLGLPSGLLWASCNVGATNPEGFGNYYAWGETRGKIVYNWETYAYGSEHDQLTKYCSDSSYGYNGFTDTLTILQHRDDAAAYLGFGARTPTKKEWQELIDNTTSEWTVLNNVKGRRFTASNGNSIFLPAAGNRLESGSFYAGINGVYWSASLRTGYPDCAWLFCFNSGNQKVEGRYRDAGFSVRAVREVIVFP